MRLIKDESIAQSRFSCVAPKKVAKTAVGRNALRRKGYIAIESRIQRVRPHYAGIFFFKSGSLALSQSEIDGEIEKLLTISGCLNMS